MRSRTALYVVRSTLYVWGCILLLAGSGGIAAQRRVALPPLARIQARHELACGVVQEDAEYSTEEDHSSRGGFDEALCRAYALAADPHASVKVTSFLDEVSAADALRAGKVDVIATLSADALHRQKGVRLSRPVFQDSLALLVPVAGGVHAPRDLAGKKVCVLAETGAEETLRAWFGKHRIDYLPFPFQEEGEMEAAYVTDNCAALAGELTRLSLIRLSLLQTGGGEAAAQHVILGEPLSHDPMASATVAGDARWAAVVEAVASALLLAEELGVGSGDVRGVSPRAREFLERADRTGAALGLRAGWAGEVVGAVGNYGQMYERTLGSGSDRRLPRWKGSETRGRSPTSH